MRSHRPELNEVRASHCWRTAWSDSQHGHTQGIFSQMSERLLWHYTNAEALFGMIETEQLHFGEVGSTNDRTERTFRDRVVLGVLDNVMASGDPLGLFAEVKEYFAQDQNREFLFAFSLSSLSDSLSQWQRYGASGRGYAVGFDPEVLASGLSVHGFDVR